MPRHKPRPPVRFTTDTDGKEIALVHIPGSNEPAKLFTEDYEALTAAGYTDHWLLNSNGQGQSYVRCSATKQLGNTETVGRLILNLPKGHRVCYQDNDRLNLRRDNLVLVERKHKPMPAPVL